MTTPASVDVLLRWRLALAERTAPPAPRAAELLARARPWWERWPERLEQQLERLQRMPAAYGYAMAKSTAGRGGHPVPTLVVVDADVETYARVLYLSVRDGRLRMRFELDAVPGATEAFEAMFVSAVHERPVLAAPATRSHAGEYRLDAELPEALAHWATLRVTDQMPFRLLLRPLTGAA